MNQTQTPRFPFTDGHARLSDSAIVAALLSAGGAAWDGKSPILNPPATGGPAYRDFVRYTDRADVRTIRIELDCDSENEDRVTIHNPGGWTDPETSRHYAEGETAVMARTLFHLRAWYQYRTGGAITREVPWTYEDFAFWVEQFSKSGGLLRHFRDASRHLNRLRDIVRVRRESRKATEAAHA